MIEDILALLRLFEGHAPDPEAHGWVGDIVAHEKRWPEAHDIFDRVRSRTLEAIERKDRVRACQYYFNEVCLQSVFNQTNTDVPFDPDAPHWIIKNAFQYARAVGIPDDAVIAIVAPRR